MKYIGVDYGARWVGIARSDESGTLAFPHGVLENNAALIARVKETVESERAEGVVIGASHNLEGEANPIMKDIEAFKSMLAEVVSVPIYFESEVYSTAAARRGREDESREVRLDASAAAIILQSFLDRTRHS